MLYVQKIIANRHSAWTRECVVCEKSQDNNSLKMTILCADQEALKYFQSVFYDAYEGAWTTKVDWFFHSAKRGFQ